MIRLFVSSLLLAASLASAAVESKPFLHGLFTGNMVVQRGVAFPVWGWTSPGAKVTITFKGDWFETRAGKDGRWEARLGPFPAGGPYTMTVSGPEEVSLRNVMVGDVWICSGQSNMSQGVGASLNPDEEIAAAGHPSLRLYTVPNRIAQAPEDQVASEWLVSSPETVARGGWGGFSAVGYYFGRHLVRNLDVPVGLIHSSWGGSPARSWTSMEALSTVPGIDGEIAAYRRQVADHEAGGGDFEARLGEWWAKNDPGSAKGSEWWATELVDSGWDDIDLPFLHEDTGPEDFDGVTWYRRSVELPDAWAGRELNLEFGPIDDIDTTWLNGVKVGSETKWDKNRSYRVPGAVVRGGTNFLAVRVLDTGGAGGIYGQPSQMRVAPAGSGSEEAVSLAGKWRFRVSNDLKRMSAMPKDPSKDPYNPTVLFNGMISPLVPFAIRGAIWYQGESDAWRAEQYRVLLPTMIEDWRSRFRCGTFPFLIVQLANFRQPPEDPGDSDWAKLREAQLYISQTVPRAGLAVAIDVGEADDIHPKNKQDVGKRLGLAARGVAYGEQIDYSGPVYRDIRIEGTTARIRFFHVGRGLVARGDGVLRGFAIAGEDGKFVWADAMIDGPDVLVSSARVARPVAVRYGWADNPGCNLFNAAGLPASPFRTDGPVRLH